MDANKTSSLFVVGNVNNIILPDLSPDWCSSEVDEWIYLWQYLRCNSALFHFHCNYIFFVSCLRLYRNFARYHQPTFIIIGWEISAHRFFDVSVQYFAPATVVGMLADQECSRPRAIPFSFPTTGPTDSCTSTKNTPRSFTEWKIKDVLCEIGSSWCGLQKSFLWFQFS